MLSEHARHQLYSKLEDVLGPDDAGTLMGYLPPSGWADVALKDDIRSLEARLDTRMASLASTLEARMDAIGSRLEARFEERLGAAGMDLSGKMRTLFVSLVGLQLSAAGLVVALSHLV